MLIDSHCHLDFPEFASDLDAVVDRARDAGVGRMITISTRVDRFPQVLGVATRFADVYCTVGTHPHQAHEEPEASLETLLRLAGHPCCVGIGEAGLDYHYDKAPRAVAARVFRTHVAAARLSGLPLVIHSREADVDMAAILTDEMGQGPFTAVMHCFTSGPKLAETALALGLFLSFSGVLTFKNARELQAIAAQAPADRILVETDAPFLAPVPHRGARNEPAFVSQTTRELARLRGTSFEDMVATTAANTARLFSKLPPGDP